MRKKIIIQEDDKKRKERGRWRENERRSELEMCPAMNSLILPMYDHSDSFPDICNTYIRLTIQRRQLQFTVDQQAKLFRMKFEFVLNKYTHVQEEQYVHRQRYLDLCFF